jgi:hypothetical protein
LKAGTRTGRKKPVFPFRFENSGENRLERNPVSIDDIPDETVFLFSLFRLHSEL